MIPFRRIRKQNLRFKFILAFLVVALVPLIVTSLYGNWTTTRTLEREAIDSALADLQLRAGQIEGYLGGAREDLLFLSQLDSVQTMVVSHEPDEAQRQRVESEFLAFAETHPDIPTFPRRGIWMNEAWRWCGLKREQKEPRPFPPNVCKIK